MAHRLREDHPGSWHHMFARGIARRTVFESVRDVRVFKCLLALEVRRGTLEVHGLAFLPSHVHLLLRSPRGELSAALKRVFAGFVRWFNRSRRRDGSLFRGRFGSRPVTSDIDRLNVIAYIDGNAVQAGLAPTPEAYAHGSARFWAGARVPPWFATEFVAQALGVAGPDAPGAWEGYQRVLGPRAGSPLARLIEERLARGAVEEDPLDDLVAAAPARVYDWMVRKAALADQTRPGIPVVDGETVDAAWTRSSARITGEVRGRHGPERTLAQVARVALLRDLGGLSHTQIAARCEVSLAECRTRYRLHASRLTRDAAYSAACNVIVSEALASVHRPAPRVG
jgi:hypothetical protein